MIEATEKTLNGFYRMTASDNWQVAYITHSDAYGELKELKRHMTTDEVMILIHGSATLYTYEKDRVNSLKMKKDVVYNIKKATWHHLKVSKDALLVVVEESNITKESTERMAVNADC